MVMPCRNPETCRRRRRPIEDRSTSTDSADTYLQLGHALKIQERIEEAVGTYFRSLALDPAPRHPRDELIALGWTKEQIEQQLRRTRVHAFAPE